jgi:hypothetical protein
MSSQNCDTLTTAADEPLDVSNDRAVVSAFEPGVSEDLGRREPSQKRAAAEMIRGEGDSGSVSPEAISERRDANGTASVQHVSEEVPPMAAAVVDVNRFYRDVLLALQDLALKGGTAIGSAAVVKRVALAHGVPAAEHTALPRLTRAEADDLGVKGASYRRVR